MPLTTSCLSAHLIAVVMFAACSRLFRSGPRRTMRVLASSILSSSTREVPTFLPWAL